jgi:aminoglycoside phosphotransferase family enzyme
MSWVFLAGERVYKLKKPVRNSMVDFSTLVARERNCREELRLNRRLAPDVYLSIAALTAGDDGRLAIDGSGTVVDWLVVMRRLPASLMLDAAIPGGTVTAAAVDSLSHRLIEFYRRGPAVEITPRAYIGQFAREHGRNRAMLTDRSFALDPSKVAHALGVVGDKLAGGAAELRDRVATQKILEGHGDLRPEHVCLEDPPVIIDCLEFNRELRLVDPVDELSFLSLECERLGAAWIGSHIMRRYRGALADEPSASLMAFYRAYRACLRCRQSVAHLREPSPRHPEKWLPLARRYLELAVEPT